MVANRLERVPVHLDEEKDTRYHRKDPVPNLAVLAPRAGSTPAVEALGRVSASPFEVQDKDPSAMMNHPAALKAV